MRIGRRAPEATTKLTRSPPTLGSVGRFSEWIQPMGIQEELNAVADKLSLREDRPTCGWCGRGKLRLVEEKPDANFGALGVTTRTLKCDDPGCGKLTVV